MAYAPQRRRSTTGTSSRATRAELCGTYHAAMLFNVHVVTEEEFLAHLREIKELGGDRLGEVLAPDYPNVVPTVPAKEHD